MLHQLRTTRAALIALFAAALLVRFFGIWYGLPAEYRPDEDYVINRAFNILVGQFDVNFFFWPSLYFWVATPIVFLVAAIGHLLGYIPWPINDAITAATTNPSPYYLAIRGFDVLCGALLVFPVYFLARRVTGRTGVSLFASATVAFAFLSVRESHFGLQDAPAVLCVATSLLFAVRGYQERQADLSRWQSLKPWVFAGLLAGTAAALKYHPGLVLIPVVTFAFLRNWRFALAATASAVICFVALSPELFIRPADVVNGMLHASESTHAAALDLEPKLGYYIFTVLPAGLGIPIIALALIGAGRALLQRNTAAVVLTVHAAIVLLFMGHAGSAYFRYLLPILPDTAILAALGIRALVDLFCDVPYRRPLVWAVVLLAVFPPLTSDIAFDRLMNGTDTRTIVYNWFLAHVPDSARVATSHFSGFFHDQHYADSSTNYTAFGPSRGITQNRLGPWREVFLFDDKKAAAQAQTLSNTDVDYIVVASPYPRQQFPETVPVPEGFHEVLHLQPSTSTDAVYDIQDGFFIPIANFDGVSQPGPELIVFESDRCPCP